jgi:hypothetical protein
MNNLHDGTAHGSWRAEELDEDDLPFATELVADGDDDDANEEDDE